MELPDCPPGAEGYQDVVVGEVPKKPEGIEESCTKAEQEFQEHLKSLKIKLEDDSARCMVEKRGRDISGKWIYLCYPCAAVCSGEAILQTHISGKKHKNKLAMRQVWPMSIFEEHPYMVNEKGKGTGATEKVLQKMAEEVDLHNKAPSDLDCKYSKYRGARCYIQDSLDALKAPLIGLEYLVEHPPEEAHHEPSYMCVLCSKQGHPRTIINHMTCFWHRYNYLIRHFAKATSMLAPYRSQNKYREGVSVIMNRLAQRIEDKFGRLRPVNIDKQEYEKDKERIHQWLFKSLHFSENDGHTFEEVVDVDLITSLHRSNEECKAKSVIIGRDPSPPVVNAPKSKFNSFTRSSARQERRAGSTDALSDISDDMNPRRPRDRSRERVSFRERRVESFRPRYEPYPDRRRGPSPPSYRFRFALKNAPGDKDKEKQRPPNYEYKVKLAEDKTKAAEESAKNTLAYHEKNPEKHPLYPEEWKKFWNRRYKEIQAEGKDPSKHDFKPEWIVFWTARMKVLHDEEMRTNVLEIYRKLCLSPPDMTRLGDSKIRSQEQDLRERSERLERSIRSQERRRSPERRRYPEFDRRLERRRTPERRPEPRRRSPELRRERRSPPPPPRRHSPPRVSARSRSPVPVHRARSSVRTHINLESSVHRSRSPLSLREEQLRNNSPQHTPSMQTVTISDDDLKPDGNLSPWNSDNDIDSLGSLPDARSPPPARSHSRNASVASHSSRAKRDYPTIRGADPQDLGPPENVVATLRMLVALEDYLGSLGPKVVDLLTEAIKMEKDAANSSEDLLERESALVLIETTKEKLKGAAQAGLVATAAAPAVRAAVVRAAATLHAADMRARKKQQTSKPAAPSASSAGMPVAGVGEVDRAQIAQQMAAALIAQGKTDVSSEELAQLVDAVVGMAEAKKREAEVKKKVEARAMSEKQARPMALSPAAVAGTASALQMLQSAYDEDRKMAEKEEVPDAMDGLSDSDLETLLKNFNELSAEEQHSLIAYLKKLEAKEPRRVEKLRQYVSAAAASAPRPEPEPERPEPVKEKPDTPEKTEDLKPVTIESDDDDYTVEEVFQSATQKVKENQIRQEMEIVKKSLEESKASPPKETPKPAKTIDRTANMSSVSDLFALVQASIQATSSATSTHNPSADVVTSNVQPRSFGDQPESSIPTIDANQYEPPPMQSASMTLMNNVPSMQQAQFNQGFMPAPQEMYGRNTVEEPVNIPHWDERNPVMNDNSGPGSNFNQHMYNEGNSMNGMPNNYGSGLDPYQNQGSFGSNSVLGAPPQFSGNQSNFGGNQGNFGGNLGNFSEQQGNFGGPPGNFGGSQGNFGGQLGNFGGTQGSFGGNQGFGGNLGNFGGNQGNRGGPHGNRGGNQAKRGGNQANRGGNQANRGNPRGRGGRGGRGNFGGPPRGRGRGQY